MTKDEIIKVAEDLFASTGRTFDHRAIAAAIRKGEAVTHETDRELLELAAKAAGIELSGWSAYKSAFWLGGNEINQLIPWNPLTDDGDALRLSNSLELELRHIHGAAHAGVPWQFWCTEHWFPAGDKNAATRLAIVRAAAKIGRAMP